jgi:6-phosphogluconate dehydrogenase
MRIGFVGLGKMGSQIVVKLLQHGHEVVALDVNPEAVAAMAKAGAIAAQDRTDLVSQLPSPAVVWLMIPAQLVEAELDEYLKILPPGSIIVDGGNSDYRNTQARAKRTAEHNLTLVDVGTSGGIMGLKNGFSMMVGGPKPAVDIVEPLLSVLSEPTGGFHHFGPTGTGHYIKMVHNGIEYAIMQAYAEGYDLLANGPIQPIDLDAVANVWQEGSIVSSKLNELIADIYADSPDLHEIAGTVDESGEGKWTAETAEAAGVPMPALGAALQVRRDSRTGHINHGTKLLAAMRNRFGGHFMAKTK